MGGNGHLDCDKLDIELYTLNVSQLVSASTKIIFKAHVLF